MRSVRRGDDLCFRSQYRYRLMSLGRLPVSGQWPAVSGSAENESDRNLIL